MNNNLSQIPEAVPATEAQKIRRSVWPLFIFAILAIAACVVLAIYHQQINDYLAGRDFEPTPEMSKLIASLELTDRADLIMRATRPELQLADDFNDNCPNDEADTSTLGCYSYTGKIYVYDVKNEELVGIHESVLAHEFLHAAYARLGNAERERVDREIKDYYESHKDKFGDYMKSYDGSLYSTELHSIVGQRVSSAELPDYLREYYAKYFTNHDAVVAYYEKYHSKFDELKERIESLKAEIETERAIITELREAYDRRLEEVRAEINRHNDRVDKNNFSSYEESVRSYESAVQHKKELEEQRLALNARVDALNEKVKIVNEDIVRQEVLYRDIDSKSIREEKPVTDKADN